MGAFEWWGCVCVCTLSLWTQELKGLSSVCNLWISGCLFVRLSHTACHEKPLCCMSIPPHKKKRKGGMPVDDFYSVVYSPHTHTHTRRLPLEYCVRLFKNWEAICELFTIRCLCGSMNEGAFGKFEWRERTCIFIIPYHSFVFLFLFVFSFVFCFGFFLTPQCPCARSHDLPMLQGHRSHPLLFIHMCGAVMLWK